METVNQPTWVPTRKLTAGMLSSSAAAIIQAYVIGQFPTFSDPLIWVPLPIIISGVVGMVVGWFVKDKPNVVPEDVKVRGVGA